MAELTIDQRKVLALAAARKRAAEGAQSQQGAQQVTQQDSNWSDLPGNIIPSMKNAVYGVANAVMHPNNTADAINNVLTGVENKIPGVLALKNATGWGDKPQEVVDRQDAAANAAGAMLKDRYGGLENIKRTMINDPFGAVLDASSLATGVGGLAAKVPAMASAGKALQTAGAFSNPVNIIAKPLARFTPLGTAPIEGQSRITSALLKKALKGDVQDFRNLGRDAMLLDSSPSMTGLAQGAAATPGAAKDMIVSALKGREGGRSNRLLDDMRGTIGPGVDPEALKSAIQKRASQQAASHYARAKQNTPEFRTPSLENTLAVQLTDPAKSLSMAAREKNLEWMNKIDDALAAETPQDAASRLHSLRQELDAHISYSPTMSSNDKAMMGVAQNVRNVVDDVLKNRIPGFAEGDAIYSKAGKAKEAIDYGYNSLEGGKSAVFPQTFQKELRSFDPAYVKEGQKSRIANALGTQANDLSAIKKMLGGDNDFNRAKLETTFGRAPIDQLVKAADREGLFSQNYADIARNSQTAQRLNAAKMVEGSGPFQISDSATATGLAGKAISKTANALIAKVAGKVSQSTADQLANALTASGADAEKVIQALLANRKIPANDRAVISALLAGRAAESSKATQR